MWGDYSYRVRDSLPDCVTQAGNPYYLREVYPAISCQQQSSNIFHVYVPLPMSEKLQSNRLSPREHEP